MQILRSSGEEEYQRGAHHPETVPPELTPPLQRIFQVEKNERHSGVVDEQHGHHSSKNVVYALQGCCGCSRGREDKGTETRPTEAGGGRDKCAEDKG